MKKKKMSKKKKEDQQQINIKNEYLTRARKDRRASQHLESAFRVRILDPCKKQQVKKNSQMIKGITNK